MKRCSMCFRDPCACPVPAWLVLSVMAGLFGLCAALAAAMAKGALLLAGAAR